jgi:hypothetical protein
VVSERKKCKNEITMFMPYSRFCHLEQVELNWQLEKSGRERHDEFLEKHDDGIPASK